MSAFSPIITEHLSTGKSFAYSPVPIVLLHGWGNSSACWETLLPSLAALAPVQTIELPGCGSCPIDNLDGLSADQYVDQLASQLPEKCILVGWSLGGELATLVAARYPEKIKGLLTLAASPQFVSDDATLGMKPDIFDNFYSGFSENAKVTLKRFSSLVAQGDCEQREFTKVLRSIQSKSPVGSELLSWLREVSLWSEYEKISCPALYVFGENDALVPISVAERLAASLPRVKGEVRIVKNRSHALPLVEEIVPELSRWLENVLLNGHCLNKKKVADSFSAAAKSYDGAADLQRRIVDKLQGSLSDVFEKNTIKSPEVIVDLGTGTGYGLMGLSGLFPGAKIFGLDIAEGMLSHARENHGEVSGFFAGDAENLPLADNSVDLIFSSLSIQWCQHPQTLFAEIQRVLKPGGSFVVATLGPDSLSELKQAWAKVDSAVHVNRFLPFKVLLDAAKSTQLNGVRVESYMDVERFESPMELFRNLKHLGAHNVNAGRPKGLTGRGRIKALCDAYEQHRQDDGLVPASWEVLTGIFVK
ncbi:MAG: malonyl-ACP O-methyltransferase BioC [Cellvibrionaceae bacterium]